MWTFDCLYKNWQFLPNLPKTSLLYLVSFSLSVQVISSIYYLLVLIKRVALLALSSISQSILITWHSGSMTENKMKIVMENSYKMNSKDAWCLFYSFRIIDENKIVNVKYLHTMHEKRAKESYDVIHQSHLHHHSNDYDDNDDEHDTCLCVRVCVFQVDGRKYSTWNYRQIWSSDADFFRKKNNWCVNKGFYVNWLYQCFVFFHFCLHY